VAKLHQKCSTQPVSGFRDNAALVGILSTQLWQRNFAENGKRAEQAA
jgi:asparagine synthase (glutamine-hydrolysing)